jgi:hypothetical protein
MIRRYVYYIVIAIATFIIGTLLVHAIAFSHSRSKSLEQELNEGAREANVPLAVAAPFYGDCECDLKDNPFAVHLGSKVLEGKMIKRVEPQYAALARNARIQGNVVVEVEIDRDGRVSCTRAIAGPPLLRAACEHAAQESLFRPTVLSGEPVQVVGILIYKVRL